MHPRSTAILLAGSLIILCSTQAFAKKSSKKTNRVGAITVTGLATMHTMKRVGNKLCMADHFHYGDGTSGKSKAQAIKAAKRSWADFVYAEYGSAWARFALAGSKGAKCSLRHGEHRCSIEARPCRR